MLLVSSASGIKLDLCVSFVHPSILHRKLFLSESLMQINILKALSFEFTAPGDLGITLRPLYLS